MKKSVFYCLALNVFVFSVLNGCVFSEAKTEEEYSNRSIIIMTWNVHNLFDGKDNGFEYDEFREANGWSAEKYLGRLNSITAAIDTIELKPDIILFQEIESFNVLDDIAHFLRSGYLWSHFAINPDSAVGLGILSRIPLSENRVHSITVNGETTPRPVMETRIDTEDGAFVVFTCHWKSKIGGDDETENVRKASARVILRRIRELWDAEPDIGIIVAGDLNETHDEYYRRSSKQVFALLPDDPYCAQLTGCIEKDGGKNPFAQKDFLVLSKNMPPAPVHFPKDTVILFSPWMGGLEDGTFFHRHKWEPIDHFLVSAQFFGSTGWKYEKAVVIKEPPFTNASGAPYAYNVRTGTGLSDHLPLLLVLKKEAE